MEINKKELRKISRKFRTLSSNVMNAHYQEQLAVLEELIDYINQTPLLTEYISSLEYPIENLEKNIERVNNSYGREALELGSNTEKRIFLLYKAFEYMVENNVNTINFGWFYSDGNKYQDMAKSFGDRLIYPFTSGVSNYLQDIATDMGYDSENMYNIAINSSGVQVNIADNNAVINANQTNNLMSEEFIKIIKECEDIVATLPNDETHKVLSENIELIKTEMQKSEPKKSAIKTCLNSMRIIATSIALIPDLSAGIDMLSKIIDGM